MNTYAIFVAGERIGTLCGTRHTGIVQFAVRLIEALYDSHTNSAATAVTAVGWVPIELESPRCALTSGIL